MVLSHTQIFRCAEKPHFRLADNAGCLHRLAQFRGFKKFLHFGRCGPAAQDGQVVGNAAGAKNLEAFLAGRFAKPGKVADPAFPLGVIGDFVTNGD